jgi:hypothetical protein
MTKAIPVLVLITFIAGRTDVQTAPRKTKNTNANPSAEEVAQARARLEFEIDLLHEAVLAMKYHMGATAQLEAATARHGSTSTKISAADKNIATSKDVSFGWVISDDDIALVMENMSDTTMRLMWDHCVFVDPSRASHRLIHSGTRLADRDASQPPTNVAPGTRINEFIYPSDYISFDKDWHRQPIFTSTDIASHVTVILALEVDGTPREYTFTFRVRAQAPSTLREIEQSQLTLKIGEAASLSHIVAVLGREPDNRIEQKTSAGTFVRVEYRVERLAFELLNDKLENVVLLSP